MPSKIRGLAKRFKTTYRRLERQSARELNRMGRLFNGARGENGIRVSVKESGIVISQRGLGGGGDPAPDSFKVTATTPFLLVEEGFILHGARSAVQVAPLTEDDEVVLEGGPYVWLYVEWLLGDITNNAIKLQAGEWPDDIPFDDGTFGRRPLRAWKFVGPDSALAAFHTHYQGDIHLGTST